VAGVFSPNHQLLPDRRPEYTKEMEEKKQRSQSQLGQEGQTIYPAAPQFSRSNDGQLVDHGTRHY